LDQSTIIAATAIFLLAGMVKGTVGLGLPMTSVGLMASLVDPRLAIAIVVFPILVTNLWQIARAGETLRCVRRFGWFATALMISLLLVTTIAGQVSANILAVAIGIVIILFSLTSLTLKVPELPDRFDTAGQVAGGVACGIIGGFTAIWSPPMVIYFLSRRLDKDEFVRASGILIFLGGLPLAFGYWRAGLLTGPLALASLAMCIPAIAGFAVGERIRALLSPERFRTVVLVFFLFLGVNLVSRAFW
jgi:uncharacterized membrane protein YfcA